VRLRGERDLLSATARLAGVRRSGAALVLGGSVLWGTAGAAQEIIGEALSAPTVGAFRTVVGGIALGLLALPGLRSGAALRLTRSTGPLLIAGACIAGYQVAFFSGVRTLGIAVGTMLAIGSAPFFAGAASFLSGRHRPSGRWFATTVLAVLGLLLLVRPDGGAPLPTRGVAAALTAGAAFGLLTVVSKVLLDRGLPRIETVAVPFLIGGLLLLPTLVIGMGAADGRALRTVPAVAAASWLALGATAAGYILFISGLGSVAAVAAATLVLAEPLTAGILGVVVFGERLSALATAGAGVVALALVLAARRPEVESAR
jgi:drug/metabolite transporter, DME family